VEWVAAEFRVDVVRSGLETSTQHDKIVATILAAFPIAGSMSGPAAARARSAMVSGLDRHWRDLLREAECLREGIELRRMGQLDPLHEWTRETYLAFSVMMESADRDLARKLSASTGGPGERAASTSAVATVPEVCWCGSGRAYEACHGRPGRSRSPAVVTE
jgi:preprotein translocase subunit SecA